MSRRSRQAALPGPPWRSAPGLSASATVHTRPGEIDDDRRTAPGAALETSSPSTSALRTPGTAQAARSTAEPVLAQPQGRLDGELPPVRRSTARSDNAGSRAAEGATARHILDEEIPPRSVRSLESISDLEAAAFAGRFAADFQSFDEDDPVTRAEVLRPLLADGQACTWGWSGVGRQRADSPLPGRIFRTSETVVFVEVVVRATVYARAQPKPMQGGAPALADVEPVGLVGPSSAPPEYDPRWRAIEANWVRMTVPVTRSTDDGRLVVDPSLMPGQSA